MADPTPLPDLRIADLRIDWTLRRDADRIEVAPLLTCASACDLRYELRTLDIPGQSLRQSGNVRLLPGVPRPLGRLAFTVRGPHCRLQLTLHDPDGREQTHVMDPCDDSPR